MIHPWIELDSAILRRNLAGLQRSLPAGTEVVFVAAHNAYGHGLSAAIRAAWASGVKHFLVHTLDDALAARALVSTAHLLLDGIAEAGDVPVLLEHRIMPLVVSEAQATALARRAASQLSSVTCHALVDTGVGSGFDCEAVPRDLPRLARLPGMKLVGVCSQFASPERADDTFRDVQSARFYRAVAECRKAGLRNVFVHMADSAAILRQRACDLDGVRAGLLAYGYAAGPAGALLQQSVTQPCLQWRTRLAQIIRVPAGQRAGGDGVEMTEDSLLGIVAAGFADGYPRSAAGAARVLVNGVRCPMVGVVSADRLIVNLGASSPAKEGDEVVLIGAQGAHAIWADELARVAGVTTHEVILGIRTDDRRETTFRLS